MAKNSDILEILVNELQLDKKKTRSYLTRLELLGSECHRLHCIDCNVGLNEFQQKRLHFLVQEAKSVVALISLNVKFYYNADPRGYPFGLILPSGRSNNFGGVDWRLDK